MSRWISCALRLALAAVFFVAGALKAFDPAQFAIDVHNYQMLPRPLSVAVAFYLPWLEIVIGLALLARGKWERPALLLALGLLLIFGGALAAAWARGLDISCGCFGGPGRANYPLSLALDAALIASALWLLRRGKA